MIEKIKWLGHSCIKIDDKVIIYVDPYNIKDSYNDANIVFITHNHYDHFSPNDIEKCINSKTILVVTDDLIDSCLSMGIKKDNIISVVPNNNYKVEDICFSTIPSYNTNKSFHPRSNNWVGYLIEINGVKYYIAGDTDITDEALKVRCDVAFVPIGGTYTMDSEEAARLINTIKPKLVVPIHYGTIVGSKEDAINFKNNLVNINCDYFDE